MVNLPEPGADWGGFRIDREIGVGGRGRTFAAFDPAPRRARALKVLLDVPSEDPAGTRFQREPLAAAELDHPNIVHAHAASDIDGVAYVMMDLHRAGSIADEVRVSILRIGRAREVLAQVASALDAAHAADLIHGNVKPTNILCADDGRTVVVSDFGSTRFVDEARRTEALPASESARLPFHEAPEVLLGDPAGPPADVYSLGSVLYLMLTGRPPYVGRSPAELTEDHRRAPVPAVGDLRPDLPDEFDELVATAMAKRPDRRFTSGQAFVAALDQAVKAALDQRRAEARHPRDVPVPSRSSTGFESPWEPESPVAPDPAAPTVPTAATAYRGSRRARRESEAWRLDDGTVDGALLGVYEDDPPNRWLAVIITVVVVALIGVVGWLSYRAVQADSDTSDLTPTTAEPTP